MTTKSKTRLGIPEIDDFTTKLVDLVKPPREKEELEAYLIKHTFNIKNLPPADAPVFFYDGILIGSRGNIVTITGKAKSRKTVVASAIATSIFIPEGTKFLGFSSALRPDERILHYDTEQGYSHYYESVVRIFRDAGITAELPERFVSVHTRDATIDLRLELLEYAIDKLRPTVVVLDGVTDLVYDINSHVEATEVGERLLAWSYKYEALFIVVIHTTKTTGYMTGAIGTYLEKKSETVIKVEKPEDREDLSHVSCQYSRNKAFKTFTIEYSEAKKQYTQVDDQNVETKGPGGKKSPEAYADATHTAVLNRLFLFRPTMIENDLARTLVKAVKHVTSDDIRAKDCKAWVEYYQERAWIFNNPEGAWMRVETVSTSSTDSTQTQTGQFNGPGSATDSEFGADDLPF